MKTYTASPTIRNFLETYQQKRVSLLLGPIGAGKTVGMLMTLLRWGLQQKPNPEGIRRTRFATVRNTRPMLRDSTLRTVSDWLNFGDPRVEWRDTQMSLRINYGLPDGTSVDTELLFRALDDQADAAKLLSVEYTGFWLSEFREIPTSLLLDIRSRAGRFPSMSEGGATHYGVIGESNFPVKGSNWYELLEVSRPSWMQVYKQPSALSSEAENLSNLADGYYENLLEGANAGWLQAHIKCEYPDAEDGKAVFSNSFVRERHVSDKYLKPIVTSMAPPILMGVDQGRNPAAVFGQLDGWKRLNVLHEEHAKNTGMRAFLKDYIVPAIREHFFNARVVVIIDPAGFNRTEVDDMSPAQVLRDAGFHVIRAPTNAIDRRLEAVERLLNVDKGILIDSSCTELIAALLYRYRYRIRRNQQLDDNSPEKTHPWSDLADALQYMCLSAGGVQYGRTVERLSHSVKVVQHAPVRGWT